MFNKTIDWQPIGTLKSIWFYRWWQGRWTIPSFGNDTFEVLIEAGKSGPSDIQQTACIHFQENALQLRTAATPIMVSTIQNGFDLPDEVIRHPERIWDTLIPMQMKVHHESYDDNGNIAIQMGFAYEQEEEHLLHFITRDGLTVDDELIIE